MVGIIIPCRGQAHYLKDALASVERQRVAVDVVVAAGSEDDASAARAHGVAKILLADRGLADARNAAIEASAGDPVLPLDADDELEPAFLLTALSQRPSVPAWIVSTDVLYTDGSPARRAPPWEERRERNPLSVTSLFPKSLWRSAGGYDPAALGWEDWDFWLRCSYSAPHVVQIHQPLLRHRVHPESMTAREVGLHETWLAMLRLRHPALFARRQRDLETLRISPADVKDEIDRRREIWPDNPAWARYAGAR